MAPRPGKQRMRRASVVEAHNVFLKYHQHDPDDEKKAADSAKVGSTKLGSTQEEDHRYEKPDKEGAFPMFQKVTKTGVIYATSRALSKGFEPESKEWANMGQGAPETGVLPGAPARNFTLNIPDTELEYAPVTGLPELRDKISTYYNHLYRQGKESQYTRDNVCVVPGGRAGLTRCMAILAECQVGYFTPDYTAYEQALGLFLRVSPSPMLHRDVNDASMPAEELAFQCGGRGVGAILMSNPANPTGQSIEGECLKDYVNIAREQHTSIIMDEFYSHYYYDGDAVDPEEGGADDDTNWPKTVSSASYIDDVNADPILIVNGLTKNWRCPGFRIAWILAPKEIVSMLGSAGSYLDGGANAPLQLLALPLMELDFIRRDTWALQRHFRVKRDFLLSNLAKLGIIVKWTPTSTFYIWADLSKLPPPLNDCLVFLEECVKHQVIVVPGVFFDINPRGLRNLRLKSKCITNVRFSYGPPMHNLELGVKQMGAMIAEWKAKPESADVYVEESF